ncbi:hypothetical protein [Vreelandella gomseomensis]|uniref:Type II secretion system protein GspC N-terminal domain-containing protein n=1 Tax=Vreelandella gomseomensis TaxID=370766 RepID=A0ABU1GD67_9GAMM|nr:hypothetical protein [Halomonas gomseomensis]MDR5875431.1 hypothetical protein [Halomonas gomseomensis]
MKYLFIGFNAIALVIVGWALTELPQSRQSSQPVGTSQGSLPEVTPVSDAEQTQFANASGMLEKLESLMAVRRDVNVNSLLAMAQRPDTQPVVEQHNATESLIRAPLPDRRLTLLLDGQSRMAMIDGALVKPGDSLPGGGRVVRIDSRVAVVREREGREQTLRLPEEETMRLGTLRNGNGANDVD